MAQNLKLVSVFRTTILFSFIILAVFYGCETNPPSFSIDGLERVKVFVSSNVDSAMIYIDNQFTGRYTPDTIDVKFGKSFLSLQKDGYEILSTEININQNKLWSFHLEMVPAGLKKTVLLENFSNIGCAPCVVPNKILKNFQSYIPKTDLVIIKYPTNFPSPNDIFYIANKTDNNVRMAYYNIMIAPSIIIDGVLWPTASDSNSIKERINTRLSEKAIFSMKVDVSGSNFAGEIEIRVQIVSFADSLINFNNLDLKIAVIENDLNFSTPPGSNGETEFSNVMRKMIPDSYGTQLNKMNFGEKQDYVFQIGLNHK